MARLGLALAGVGLGVAAWSLRPGASISGQTALVTGGSRGLGLQIAHELARAGCRVAICARDHDELARAREQLVRAGADAFAVPGDVGVRRQVEELVAEVSSRFGRIDILVNNAGTIGVGPVQTTRPADYEEALGTMYWGVVYPTLAVLPQMRARRSGRIANVTSLGGKVSVPHLLPYSSAKFAAVGFSEGLRAELASDGITVTTVVPGLLRTGAHIRARFKGDQNAEYTWFQLGATLPFIAMNPERAARRIVLAIRRGEAEVLLGWPAWLAAKLNGLAPGIVSDLSGIADRLLPSATAVQSRSRPGRDLRSPVESTPLGALGDEAVERYQNLGGS